MIQWIILILTVIVLIALAVSRPLWLVPLLAVAVALEISSTWYPSLGQFGAMLDLVTLTRLTTVVIILTGFVRLLVKQDMRRKLGDIIRDPLTIVLFIFLLLGAISVLYSADSGKTLVETVRLVLMFLLMVAVALLMNKKRALIPFHAVHITALLLAPLAFYEGITGNLIWQQEILFREQILRVNATFVDPNIYARFIVLAIAANFVLQLTTREKQVKTVYYACLAILLAELLLTSSRGGLITLVVILVAALILLPNKKAALWVLGLGVFCGAIVLFLRPDIWDRMVSITQGLSGDSQRLYLWKAAIAIFMDNLLVGTGLGSFQTVFLQKFSYVLSGFRDGATLSHTSILTVAAELGMLGLIVLAAIWVILIRKLWQYYGISGYKGHDLKNIFDDSVNEYFAGAGYFLWVLAIFVSSQGEGRFFEDPMLWLSCAMLIAIKFSRESISKYLRGDLTLFQNKVE